MADKTKKYQAGGLVIKIDRSKCISCGACSYTAPKTFELDSENIAVVKSSGPYDTVNTIKEAVEGCAVAAITIESSK